ncbi:hypothetical protein LCGC14_0893250 [marine sediment metagenome]|uniref:Uncharacterized protein n=1 Tax=marine sediment metagenome TaxID=412755 RepID=A0A0F9PJB1_9ZZZZ
MSVGGSPGSGCDPDPDAGKICDCLGCSLEEIAHATEDIAAILDEKLGKVCDNIDECIDEIIDAINSKFGPGLSTISECQRLLSFGLGGTLEYAIRCAGVVADECDASCSLGLPENQGKCCTLPDGTEGICRNGVCVPTEPEEKKEGKFIGWCDLETKVVIVTKEGDPGPGGRFKQVAFSETEIVAFREAESFCEGAKREPELPSLEDIPGYGSSRIEFCSLDSLISGATLDIAEQAQATFLREGGATQVANAFADIGAFGITVGDLASVTLGLGRMAFAQPSYYSNVAATKFAPVVGCENPTFKSALELIISAQLWQHQSGANIEEFLTPYKYAMHAACRQKHLDPDKAIAAYLGHTINRQQLEGLWAIHGVCPEDIDWYLGAARAKPLPLQLAIMRHREFIDPSVYHERMRELGYLESNVREQMFDITRQVPPLTEILRYMVRDADDEALVAKFGLDTQFDLKYGAQLKKWARDQGVPDLMAKFSWRAHWTIPPPSQLFQFWHRLRNDDRFGGKAKLLDDIKSALIQQDILPFWHEHYLAVSFRPMRLRDIRRSYQIGTLTDDEAKHAFTQLGYSDDTVALMFRFLQRLRDNSIANNRAIKLWLNFVLTRSEADKRLSDEGYPNALIQRSLDDASIAFVSSPFAKAFARGDLTATELAAKLDGQGVKLDIIQKIIDLLSLSIRDHWATTEFEAGVITESDAQSRMSSDGIPPETVRSLLAQSNRDVLRKFIISCQNGIKRRFLMGELDKAEASSELVLRQTVGTRAAELVNWWECELKSGERHVSAVTLCGWLERGAISSVSFVDRLKKIGFDATDAALIMDDCLIKVSAKRLAQAKKEVKERVTEQARISRILARGARDEERALAKLTAMRRKAASTRDRRLKQLHKAIDKVTDKGRISTNEAYKLLETAKARIERELALSQDQALQALLLAAEEWTGESTAVLVELIDTIAQRVSEADIGGETAELPLAT